MNQNPGVMGGVIRGIEGSPDGALGGVMGSKYESAGPIFKRKEVMPL
jgi:hypothetical protein